MTISFRLVPAVVIWTIVSSLSSIGEGDKTFDDYWWGGIMMIVFLGLVQALDNLAANNVKRVSK